MSLRQQSSKLLPRPLLSAALIALWLALVNKVTIAHCIVALLLAWLLPLLLHKLAAHGLLPQKLLARAPSISKPWMLLRFIAMVGWDIVVANLEVAIRILQPNHRLRPAFIEMPLSVDGEGLDKSPVNIRSFEAVSADNDFVIALLMSVITLTPGTLAAQLSEDRRSLLIHVLHSDDPAALIAQLKQRYERPLRQIFG